MKLKVANNLKWPEDHWALLLQSSLVVKAREIHSALESSQYSLVKNARIRASTRGPQAEISKCRETC